MDQKRTVFTREENEILLTLINEKLQIIECKETNKVSIKKKNDAWIEISKRFNTCLGVTCRTPKQLRQRYLNMKKDANKLAAAKRAEQRKTGNVPSETPEMDTIQERILDMGVVTTPLPTIYDSDACHLDCTLAPDNYEAIVVECSLQDDENDELDTLDAEGDISDGFHDKSRGKSFLETAAVFQSPVTKTHIETTLSHPLPSSQHNPLTQTSSQQSTLTHMPTQTPSSQHSTITTIASQQVPHTSSLQVPPIPTPSNAKQNITSRRALDLFRRGGNKRKPEQSASSRAAESIIEEKKLKMEFLRNREEREAAERKLRIQQQELELEILKNKLKIQEKKLQKMDSEK